VWVQQRHYKAVGDALAGARRRAGMTQDDVARKLSKPQSFVSSYERGQRRVDVLELVRIVEAIGDDPARIFADVLARHPGKHRR
jgi:transcriptional regulator with XRE-family HTH domain